MASPQALDKFAVNNKVNMFNVDGDYTTAAICSSVSTSGEVWLDMKGYSGLWVGAMGVNLTGVGPSALSIIGDSDSDGGSGNNVTVATSADTAVSAEGGWISVEASAEQIKQEGNDDATPTNLRYVGIQLTMANAADEAAIVVVRYGPRFSYDALTAGSAANTSIT